MFRCIVLDTKDLVEIFYLILGPVFSFAGIVLNLLLPVVWAFMGVKGVLRGLVIGQDDAQVTSCEVSWTRKLDNSHASPSMEGCKSRHKLVS